MDKYIEHEQGKYKPVRHGQPLPQDNWPYNERPDSPDYKPFADKAPKFERHIFIMRDQLLYDIDAQIGMMATARRNPDGTEENTFSNATTTYRQQFYRWIEKHIGIAKGVMSAFLLEKFKTTKLDNISQEQEVDITLLMPEWYDDTVFDQLCQAVHQYVVDATLYEFFSIALLVPTRRSVAEDPATIVKRQQMAQDLQDIRKYVNASKPGRIHKILKPF